MEDRYRNNEMRTINLGPWGGPGGRDWSFNADGSGNIKQIVIAHGQFIDSIQFRTESRGGYNDYSNKFGGSGGRTDKVDLDWPREYLKSITGFVSIGGSPVVTSVSFVTNVTTYGPFGRVDGAQFNLLMEGGVIVGFHGRCGDKIDAIGVYIKPLQDMGQGVTSSAIHVDHQGPGPWNGPEEKPWDDGVPRGPGQWNGQGDRPWNDGGSRGPGQWGGPGERPWDYGGSRGPGSWGGPADQRGDNKDRPDSGPWQGPGQNSWDGRGPRGPGPQGAPGGRPWDGGPGPQGSQGGRPW